MNKIIIIDGNSLLFRAFYATYGIDPNKIMHNHNGIPTNAIFAFSNMISNLLKEIKEGDGILVAFDKGKETFRHKEYKDYKANRIKAPEELFIQMPIAREFLTTLNIKYYEFPRPPGRFVNGQKGRNCHESNRSRYRYKQQYDPGGSQKAGRLPPADAVHRRRQGILRGRHLHLRAVF